MLRCCRLKTVLLYNENRAAVLQLQIPEPVTRNNKYRKGQVEKNQGSRIQGFEDSSKQTTGNRALGVGSRKIPLKQPYLVLRVEHSVERIAPRIKEQGLKIQESGGSRQV